MGGHAHDCAAHGGNDLHIYHHRAAPIVLVMAAEPAEQHGVRALLRVRNNGNDVVGAARNIKIETVVSVYSPLPNIITFIVFLGSD
jgi:hypothetical protein